MVKRLARAALGRRKVTRSRVSHAWPAALMLLCYNVTTTALVAGCVRLRLGVALPLSLTHRPGRASSMTLTLRARGTQRCGTTTHDPSASHLNLLQTELCWPPKPGPMPVAPRPWVGVGVGDGVEGMDIVRVRALRQALWPHQRLLLCPCCCSTPSEKSCVGVLCIGFLLTL